MDRHDPSALQALSLRVRRRLERFAMGAKPHVLDTIAADSGIHTARNRLYLGQFWHRFILGDEYYTSLETCNRRSVLFGLAVPAARFSDAARFKAHNPPLPARVFYINACVPVAAGDVSVRPVSRYVGARRYQRGGAI